MTSLQSVAQVGKILLEGHQLVDDAVSVYVSGIAIRIRSNSTHLLELLADYFSDYITEESDAFQFEITAIESDSPQLPAEFIDWRREPGKTGKKDSYVDFADGRVLRKVKTGLVFLQSHSLLVAVGGCEANSNQVINFVNAQVMNQLQHSGWLLCHAAGLVHQQTAIAFAGFSGGGKSTLMLRMMQQEDMNYLTNDRLLIESTAGLCRCAGIAKLPRINPGTLINDPYLRSLATEAQCEQWQSLAKPELWALEQKYDVPVTQIYGEGRLEKSLVTLGSLFILNWQHQSLDATQLQRVDLGQRSDLLAAVMKSPGPFYQGEDGQCLQDGMALNESSYLQALKNVAVYEITGLVDFDAAANLIRLELAGNDES